jgi:hypothetical protein
MLWILFCRYPPGTDILFPFYVRDQKQAQQKAVCWRLYPFSRGLNNVTRAVRKLSKILHTIGNQSLHGVGIKVVSPLVKPVTSSEQKKIVIWSP